MEWQDCASREGIRWVPYVGVAPRLSQGTSLFQRLPFGDPERNIDARPRILTRATLKKCTGARGSSKTTRTRGPRRGRPGAASTSSSAGRARGGPTWWRGSRPAVPTPRRGDTWPRPWPDAAGDPSAVQFRFELKERGISALNPERVRHAVTSGQDVLRSLILSGEDSRRLFIHPRCTRTVEAFKNYRATELAEGIYDPRPDPGPSNHTFSHGTDQARCLCWTLRTAFGRAGYEV